MQHVLIYIVLIVKESQLINKFIFTMNLMATTNQSDNKIKLVTFSSSSGLAFSHTVKS